MACWRPTQRPLPTEPRGRSGRRRETCERAPDDLDGRLGAVLLALLEIAVDLAQLVGDVGEAEDRLPARSRKGVERRGFHLDREDAELAIASIAAVVSRKGASVVQLAPRWTG